MQTVSIGRRPCRWRVALGGAGIRRSHHGEHGGAVFYRFALLAGLALAASLRRG